MSLALNLDPFPTLPELERLYQIEWETNRPGRVIAWSKGKLVLGGVAAVEHPVESTPQRAVWRGWVDTGTGLPHIIDRPDQTLEDAKRRVLLTFHVLTV